MAPMGLENLVVNYDILTEKAPKGAFGAFSAEIPSILAKNL